MAAKNPLQNPSEDTVEIVNFFRKYRGFPEWSDDDIRDNFQKQNYQPPARVQLPEPPQVDAWPPPKAIKPAKARTQAEEGFLASTIPDLEDPTETAFAGGPGNWKAIKVLGTGGFGMVALWEYQGPENVPDQKYRQVVVKEVMGGDPKQRNMSKEHKILKQLHKTGSAHVSHELQTKARRIDADAENIDKEWNGRIKRLILEYCPLGDMKGLIERFQALGKPLREISIWKIFDCLVDGLFVLDTGNEAKIQAPINEVVTELRDDWNPIVHFDLKPENILLSEDRFTHFTPLCKLGDFGLAERETDYSEWLKRHDLRKSGTAGYYAPEQFSGTWEGRDYEKSRIAGNYGFKTNVWGIGCILYQLVLLGNSKPDQKQPFEPTWQINGEKAKGNTFGLALHGRSEHYSRALTDLVQECLYERPAHRPSLEELKTRVRDGYQTALDAGGTQDAWEDFLPAPPLPAPLSLCKAKLQDGRNCQTLLNMAISVGFRLTRNRGIRSTKSEEKALIFAALLQSAT